jgi:hypothetical protein
MRTWQVYLEGKNLTNANGVTFPGIFGLPDFRAVPRSLGVLARAQFSSPARSAIGSDMQSLLRRCLRCRVTHLAAPALPALVPLLRAGAE